MARLCLTHERQSLALEPQHQQQSRCPDVGTGIARYGQKGAQAVSGAGVIGLGPQRSGKTGVPAGKLALHAGVLRKRAGADLGLGIVALKP